MKVLKILCGSAAGLYVLAQLVFLPKALAEGRPLPFYMGIVAGCCIAAAISVACFLSAFARVKEPKSRRRARYERHDEEDEWED